VLIETPSISLIIQADVVSPQVVAEDGTLSPPAPPPGLGLPIPPDALNHVYAVYANIGNDLSPVTRKKAKKILVAAIVVGQISKYRFRQLSS